MSNSHKRPKPTIWWRVRDWFSRLTDRVGRSLGNAAESFEWMIANLGTLLLPWNWFRRQNAEGDFEEFPREQGQRSWVESFEFFFHRLFSTVALLFMPWRWFRPKQATSNAEALGGEGHSSLSEASEWIIGTFFEKVGDVFRLMGQILVPKQVLETTENVQRSLTESTLRTSYKVEQWFSKVAERFLPRRIFWPIYWVGRRCFDAFDFVSEWWWSRDYLKLTWAAPALLLCLPISVSVVLGLWNNDSRKINHYRSELKKAQAANEEQRAALLKQRLEQLDSQRAEVMEFRAALALASEERFEEAYEKIKPLTSPTDEDESGLLEGHLWIASQLLHGNLSPKYDDGSLKDPWGEFKQHVDSALAQDPRNPWALRYRIEVLLHQQRWADAVEQMESLVDEFPDFHATLAHTYDLLGNKSESRLHARRAIAYFERLERREARDEKRETSGEKRETSGEKRKASDENTVVVRSAKRNENTDRQGTSYDASGEQQKASSELAAGGEEFAEQETVDEVPLTPLGFLRMAQVYSLVDDGDRELAILATGARTFPNHQQIRDSYDAICKLRLRQYEFADPRMQKLMVSLSKEDRDNKDVAATLVRGLLANETPEGLAKIGLKKSLIVDRDHEAAAAASRKIYQHLLDNNLLSSDVYLRLGNYFLVANNYKAAARYYQDCCKANPQASSAWNNLAWLLADESINDLKNALRAVNRAIEIKPDVRYMETRGQIYMKLERWQDAVTDLEVAISGGIQNGIKTHESLANCYAELGFEEQAEAHRRIVNEARR